MMLNSMTVVMMAATVSMIMSWILFSVGRDLPSSIRGVRLWAWASLVLAIAGFCYSGRTVFPEWLSIFVANLCMLSGGALWVAGTQQFYERPQTTALLAIVLIIGISGVVLGWLVSTDFLLRMSVMIACMATFNAVQLGIMLRYGERHYSTFFLALSLTIQIGVMLLRGLTAHLSGFHVDHFFSPDPIQIMYHAAFGIVTLLVAVGYVILATRRLTTELSWHATRDFLTGILNRRAFNEIGECVLKRAFDAGRPFSVLIIDLDHFKAVNDQYGHNTGDKVLIDFCRKIESQLATNATFARLGGEEFIIASEGMSEAEALKLAESIQEAVADRRDTTLPSYTCSIGIATAYERSTTLSRLMATADDALYLAKNAGRNMVKQIGMPADSRSRDAVRRAASLGAPSQTKA